MQFRDVAIAAQAPNPVREADIEMFNTHELQEGPLWVSRRDDAIRLNFFSVFQLHASRKQSVSAAVNEHATNFACVSDLGT